MDTLRKTIPHAKTARLRANDALRSRRSIQPGYWLRAQGRTYQVTSETADNPLLIPVLDVETGELDFLSYAELVTSLGEGDEPLIVAPTRQTLEQDVERLRAEAEAAEERAKSANLPAGTMDQRFLKLIRKARRMVDVVKAVELMLADAERRAALSDTKLARTKALIRACNALNPPISKTTYYAYRDRCAEQSWDEQRIAASLHRSTFNTSQLDPASLHFVDAMLMRFYGRNRPITVSRLYEEFVREYAARTGNLWVDPAACTGRVREDLIAELLNAKLPMQAILDNPEKRALLKPIKLPGRSWIYAYARWFLDQPGEGRGVIVARYGKAAWEAERMVFDTFVMRAVWALQYVFADHYLIDVFVVDKETRSKPHRLWLTVLIDAYSRCIIGMALLYEEPCIESVQQALRHGIWPKGPVTEDGPTREWEPYGIPVMLFLDNAWAHHSHSLEALASQISRGGKYDSIMLEFRVPYKARRGALVDRFFGNLSRQIKELLPGAIKSSHPADVISASEGACLLYADLHRYLHQIIDKYHHTPHSGLDGQTPVERWRQSIRSRVPLVPPLTEEAKRLFLRLEPETRQINQKGISAFGMHYWSHELAQAERVGRDGNPIEYQYRYDPADISRLALFRGGSWVGDVYAKQRRLPDGSTAPVSLVERELARTLALRHSGQAGNWLEYLGELDATIGQRQAEKRASRVDAKPVKTEKAHAPRQGRKKPTRAVGTPSPDAVYGSAYTDLLAGFLNDD